MSEMQMEQNGPPQSFPPPKPQVPEAGSHAKQYSCPQATILIQTAGIGGWHPLNLQLAMCPTLAALLLSGPERTSGRLEIQF